MSENKFGNLLVRVVGNISGYPLVGVNTMPMMIDDCPVLINFAQADAGASSSELKLSAVEQALRATYEPGTSPTPEPETEIAVPTVRVKNTVPTTNAAEFKQLLVEGVAALEKENLSVDL